MAYFPGYVIYGTAIKLQYRVFLYPDLIFRVKRNTSTIFCAKGRDYSNSFAVKYLPEESSKDDKDGGASLPGRYLEKRHNGTELNVRRVDFSKNSSRICLDVESRNHDSCRTSNVNFGLNFEVEEEVEEDFMVLDDKSEETDKIFEDSSTRCRGIQLGCTRQNVEKSAIELLASRAFTALELKKKLQAKGFPLEIVEAVIVDFQSRGLINDCLYAETYSRSRWSSSSWGPRRIRQELFRKGVSEVDAEKAIKLVFENNEGSEDVDSGIAMSKLSIDQLYVQASKQWQRSRGVPLETRKSRIIRWLQYRGFNWCVIKYVMKKLQSEGPS
ncbi:hypothetical protein CDL12_10017 [Handroanthus impetiginosus]|uniref:Regulatory protein RecX n=1 Tax=Handroanthus impetiginosus TaxID=429701 RepID=A0A2G9HIF3_9LAMI|nr:hypothetical protein CDL12_10017 [Handroanthus impetiginosus]